MAALPFLAKQSARGSAQTGNVPVMQASKTIPTLNIALHTAHW
jgi:hypothetical protein